MYFLYVSYKYADNIYDQLRKLAEPLTNFTLLFNKTIKTIKMSLIMARICLQNVITSMGVNYYYYNSLFLYFLSYVN